MLTSTWFLLLSCKANIKLSMEEIKELSKVKFKKIVKESVKKEAFDYLMAKK